MPLTVPVCSVMTPPETDEAVPVLPLAVSIAASRLATVPVVEIWLAPAVPDTKVSVLPSTTRVSPALKPLVRAPTEEDGGSRQQRGAGQRRGAGGAAAARLGDAGAKAEFSQRVAGAGDGQVGGGAGLQHELAADDRGGGAAPVMASISLRMVCDGSGASRRRCRW